MNRDRARAILAVLLGVVLCGSCTLSGCGLLAVRASSAHYTLSLPEPGQARVLVRARFSGLEAGPLDLVMLRQWAGYGGLADQLVWLRIAGARVEGSAGEGPPLEQDAAYWHVQVPLGGRLELEYALHLAGRDGALPSQVTPDYALLLARSLFILPASWLREPRLPLPAAVQVALQPPQGWSVHSTWPLSADGATYLPQSAESLLGGALALGSFAGYELHEDAFRARILLPKAMAGPGVARRAGELAQGLLGVQRFFGTAPDLSASMELVCIILPDAGPSAPPAAEALADNLVLARSGEGLGPALAASLRRAMLQLWIGGALRAAPRWAPDALAREAWFTWGWSEYLAWSIPFEAGHLSALSYWEHLRHVAQSLAENPATPHTSLADAAPRMAGDPLLAQLVRDKGHLGALLLEQRLRAETNDAQDLRAALQQLLYTQNYYTSGALVGSDEVLRQLGDLSGGDHAPFLAQLWRGVGPLDLSRVAQLSGPPVGETRALVSADGLQLVYQWLDGPAQRAAIYLGDGPGLPPYDALYTLGEALRSQLDVAYLEQRGSGRSEGLGRQTFSLDAMLNDIELLREQLGANRVVLIGHAWGGYLALGYTLRYPERVEALVLLAPLPSFPRLARAGLETLTAQYGGSGGEVAAQVRRLSQSGVHTYADWATLTRLLVQAGAYGSNLNLVRERINAAQAHYEAVALLPQGLSPTNEEVLPVLAVRDGLLQRDSLAEWAPAGYPVLILHGDQDRFVPRSLLETLAGQLGAQVRTIPQAGHYLYLDNPSATLAEITAFLAAYP